LHCLHLRKQGAGAALTAPGCTLELRQFLQHLVGRRHCFTVNFIRALNLDHIHQLFRHVNVRGFNITLIQQTRAVQPGVLSFGVPEDWVSV